MQKYGFCFLNVVLLQSVSNLIGNPSATFWQSVRNVLAIRSQCFGNPSAAVGGPIYRIRVHEYPEIILRIYAVGITIRIISTYQNHLGWIEEWAR